MDIGKRLRELREAKGLSQGDVKGWGGLSRHYVSRVENGHATPSLPVLERWARALDVELYQLFFVGHGQPESPVLPERIPVESEERALLGLFSQMSAEDKALLISLAREILKQKGILG